MAKAKLGTARTFDIVASGRKTSARQTRRRVGKLALGAGVLAAGIAVGGRLGSGIAVLGVYLFARALEPLKPALMRRLKGRDPHADEQVDQALWETFPASDPPALSPARAR
jgi:hypothetical protein